ncbi:MAG: TIGR03936 family radical SAM-associated protein [Bacteroidales bacterium]|nr:TIGR03936 family radical SAM-associated protein [Bacteroidales bacterium]
MKVRIKYTKSGCHKFIGHLDIMRYFQKAVKRAGLDIAYSKGFSPHQLMSFAAPLALGVTSEGEYFDAEFNSLVSSAEFVRRFNEQMVEGMAVNDVVLLPDNAKNAMSVVAASDYVITVLPRDAEGNVLETGEREASADVMKKLRQRLAEASSHLLEKEKIEVLRKTKKSEKIEDIKKGIYRLYPDGENIYMLLAAGSEYNLKPELVVEALCRECGYEYRKLDYQIHRIETYMKNEEGSLVSLLESGTRIPA